MAILHRYLFQLVFLVSFMIFSPWTLAQDCADEVIPSIPFTITGTTCGAGNDYGNSNACGEWFLTGEDFVYAFTTTNQTCVQIDLSGYVAGSTGIILTTGCPDDMGGTCVGSVYSSWGATSLSLLANTQPETTYYLTISTDVWTVDCTDFDLAIGTNCPPFTTGDCFGSLNLCEGYLYQEVAPLNDGLYPDILPANGCNMSNVANEGWYIINVQEDGILNFTLTPNANDDYDWILFDLTNASCDAISSNPDLIVGCNSFGQSGGNGATGISSAAGGVDTANGPGSSIGESPFNADLPVLAGETYALMISNWSATTNGYTLDFGASSAGFEDSTPPQVEDISYTCSGIQVLFSEYIDCSTVLPEHFTIEGPGGPFSISDLESNCTGGVALAVNILITTTPDFPVEGGTYNLVFQNGEIADLCGNYLEAVSIPFQVSAAMDVTAVVDPVNCGNSNGAITLTVEGGLEPLQYSLNGATFQDSPLFSNLPTGEYTVSVQDAGGCEEVIVVEVWEEIVNFTAGSDNYTCDNTFYTVATLPDGYSGSWSGPPTVEFEDASQPQTLVSAAVSGVYELVWTIANNFNCTYSLTIRVSFSSLGVGSLDFEPVSCFNTCDGTYTVNLSGVANADEINYDWSSGNTNPAIPETVTDLCPGLHMLTVQSDSGCILKVPVVLNEPESLIINDLITTTESCPGYLDGSIEIISENAVSYSFNGGESYSQSSSSNTLGSGPHHIYIQGSSGCTRDTVITLLSPSGPTASFDAVTGDASIYEPVFRFKNYSSDYTTSHWQFGYPYAYGTSDEDEPVFWFNEVDTGQYVIMLVVFDDGGCSDTTFQNVTIYEDASNFIPNAFSPNEDGVNDFFRPILSHFDKTDYRMQIFDRWGRIVFETESADEGWNGSANGKEYYVEPGVYIYAIRVKSKRTREITELKGTVTVIR